MYMMTIFRERPQRQDQPQGQANASDQPSLNGGALHQDHRSIDQIQSDQLFNWKLHETATPP